MSINVKNWTDTLRSGIYNQAPTYLYDGDNYCCLGVLCEITNKDYFKPYEKEDN